MKNLRNKQGFTLVELIVVIAILAILVSVVIPSFIRYIDRSRFSNDVQKAASMTNVVRAYQVENNAILDAHDIETIIEDYHGETFDFTPSASDTGFFYIQSSDTVVASKYEDAEELFEELDHQTNILLSNHEIEGEITFNTPAELFGSGNHLLTRDGSVVAYAVDFIYRLASTGSALDASYGEGYDVFEDYTSEGILDKIIGMLGFGVSDELENKLKDLLDYYDPQTTLYVNDGYWATTAVAGANIEKIVFAPGITNIPEFEEELDGIALTEIKLPRTIRSIETNAFGNAFDVDEVVITGDHEIKVAEGAFNEGISVSKATTAFDKDSPDYQINPGSTNLITYDDSIVDSLTLDLTDIKAYFDEANILVTSYSIDLYLSDLDEVTYDDLKSKVYIYTREGYLGYVVPIPDDLIND